VKVPLLQVDILGFVKVRKDKLVRRIDPHEAREIVGVRVEREEVDEIFVAFRTMGSV
jgi:hypothetical protein